MPIEDRRFTGGYRLDPSLRADGDFFVLADLATALACDRREKVQAANVIEFDPQDLAAVPGSGGATSRLSCRMEATMTDSLRIGRFVSLLAGAGISCLALSAAWGQDSAALPKGFKTTPLLKSGKTADGDSLAYPATGKPEVVSVIGVLDPGGRTALHQHPVPVYVYVMEGTLEVQTEGKGVRSYKTGEAFLESVGHWHQAFNRTGQPAKLLVVFVGEEGKPTTQNKQ
jgi:quercetin dioxygenase-like cupin family protein